MATPEIKIQFPWRLQIHRYFNISDDKVAEIRNTSKERYIGNTDYHERKEKLKHDKSLTK